MFPRIIFSILLIFPFQLFATELSDTCGKEWYWANPLPQGFNLNDIVWNPEHHQFLAVGDHVVMSSYDGVTWEIDSSPVFTDVVWTGSMYVASYGNLNNSSIYVSYDGIFWSEQDSNNEKPFITELIYANNKIIAIGSKGLILTSSDGLNWSTVNALTNEYLTDIVWSGNQFVAVGYNGTILTSDNGEIWILHLSDSKYSFKNIVWNGNHFLAMDNAAKVLTSSDGINWVESGKYLNEDIQDIIWAGNQFVAVGGDFFNGSTGVEPKYNYVATSIDGKNWEKQFDGSLTAYKAVAFSGDKYVAIGIKGITRYSYDGLTWHGKTYPILNDIVKVVWNGNQFLALDAYSYVLTSQDGLQWEIRNNLYHTIYGKYIQGNKPGFTNIAWNGELYVVSGQSGLILTSKDGVTWEQSDLSRAFIEVVWTGKQFVAGTVFGDIYTSPDGSNWTQQESNWPSTRYLYDIVWTGEFIVATGSQYIVSKDAIDWEFGSYSGWSAEKPSIIWSGDEFISLGDSAGEIQHAHNNELNYGDGEGYDNIIWTGSYYFALPETVNSQGLYSQPIEFSSDGKKWSYLRMGYNDFYSLTAGEKQIVAVGEDGAIFSSPCFPKQSPYNTHALIIAGGGNADDPLQAATNANANLAYRTLRQRGIAANNIRYFNAIAQDADNDEVVDTEPGKPTREAIEQSITGWAAAGTDVQTPVLVYLIDHGGADVFYLNKPGNDYAEVMTAAEVSQWLNTLQEKTKARVTLVYDACHSGSFMDELQQSPVLDFDRTLLFSSAPEQLAYFGAQGGLSYSHFFWNNIGQGMDVRTAHRSATVAVRATTQNDGQRYQQTQIDDNGDGQQNYVDGSLARDTYLGIDQNRDVVYPQIVKHQGSATLDISDNGSVDLFARVDLPPEQIKRVWAVVIPPNSKTTGSEAITELPVIELDRYNPVNGHFEASSSIFTQAGQYTVSYYARTTKGVDSRFPVVSLITVTDSGYQALEQQNLQAVIVVGGDDGYSPLHKAATNNANRAYQTLRNRGINADAIYYLNAVPQDVDGNGQTDTQDTPVNASAIGAAIGRWAKARVDASTPLLVYLVGDGGEQQFILNNAKTETLSADKLAGLLNSLQQETKTRVTLIYDAPQAGSFMPAMATPDKSFERINLFSSESGQGAYFGAEGQLSFSYFFWSQTARGLDVRKAFLNTRRTMATATRSSRSTTFQQALMDDNGDGVWDSHSDGKLAQVTYLGLNAATASTFPVVFGHQGNTTYSPQSETSLSLSARVDLPPKFIERVWVLINAPNQNVGTVYPITNLPAVALTYNPATRAYEGQTTQLTEQGEYQLTYYAQSYQGNISEPLSATVQVGDAVPADLCASVDSNIELQLPCVVVGSDVFNVTLKRAIHPQHPNDLLWQLNSVSAAPDIVSDNEVCTAIDSQLNLLLNCIHVGDVDYKIILNFYPESLEGDDLLWEFGGFID